jgi:hypothetical protein
VNTPLFDTVPTALDWASLCEAEPRLESVALSALAVGAGRPKDQLGDALAQLGGMLGPNRDTHRGPEWLRSEAALEVAESHLMELVG